MDGFRRNQHFVERHGQRVFIAQRRVCQAVADENQIAARFIRQPRSRIIVGRYHHDLLPARLQVLQVRNRNFGSSGFGLMTHRKFKVESGK
jgi:hypothetical protein